MENIQVLSERELEIMIIIWDNLGSDFSISTTDILTNLKLVHCKRYLQPLQVVLRRLVIKEYLKCEKIRCVNYYTPLCEKKEYFDFAMQDFLEHNYPNETKVEQALHALSHMGMNQTEIKVFIQKLLGA